MCSRGNLAMGRSHRSICNSPLWGQVPRSTICLQSPRVADGSPKSHWESYVSFWTDDSFLFCRFLFDVAKFEGPTWRLKMSVRVQGWEGRVVQLWLLSGLESVLSLSFGPWESKQDTSRYSLPFFVTSLGAQWKRSLHSILRWDLWAGTIDLRNRILQLQGLLLSLC